VVVGAGGVRKRLVTQAGEYRVTRANVRGAAAAIATVIVALTIGCGGGGGRDTPDRPTVDVDGAQLVDVGERFNLNASGSFNPTSGDLSFFWTLLPPSDSDTQIDDHCEDNPDEVCIANVDACSDDALKECTTNSDCEVAGCQTAGDCAVCVEGHGQTSPQCTTGRCDVDQGRRQDFVTFLADVRGPYTMRVLFQTNDSNDTGAVALDTYPSLYLLGSLFELGGTHGGLVGEFSDADTFADGAVALVTSPETGNLLLAIPGPPGRVLEFNYRDGTDIGVFGETGDFVQIPVAMAFDNEDRILIAGAAGGVDAFDATQGRFIRTVADVTTGTEEVSAIAISPVTNDLLVVDGRAGQPVRAYNSSTGAPAEPPTFGDIGTVAAQAVDLAFLNGVVFVADAAGHLVTCTNAELGTNCSVVTAADALLQPNGPTSIAVNPAADATDADVLIADSVAKAVIACKSDGSSCTTFGESAGLDSEYLDLAFAPAAVPAPEPPPQFTTTTTSTTLPAP
jgi:hypothetical protein